MSAIKVKNSFLSHNLKFNIIKELSTNKKISLKLNLKKAQINSREIMKDDIFFAIKGKKNDGNKFIGEAFKKKASLAIVNKINKSNKILNQIKVKDTLKFLTESSKIYRKRI